MDGVVREGVGKSDRMESFEKEKGVGKNIPNRENIKVFKKP